MTTCLFLLCWLLLSAPGFALSQDVVETAPVEASALQPPGPVPLTTGKWAIASQSNPQLKWGNAPIVRRGPYYTGQIAEVDHSVPSGAVNGD